MNDHEAPEYDPEGFFAELLREQDGRQRAWNSLVETPLAIDGVTLRHLGSQRDLCRETRRMRHSAMRHWPRCVGGASRIFALERRGENVATGELVLNGVQWTVGQVRGFLNEPVAPDLEKVMEELARRYDAAWRNGERHHSWRETARGEEL